MPALVVEHRVQHAFHPYQTTVLVGGCRQKSTSSHTSCGPHASSRKFSRVGIDSRLSQTNCHIVALKFDNTSASFNRRLASVPSATPLKSPNAESRNSTADLAGLKVLPQTHGIPQVRHQSNTKSHTSTRPATAPAPLLPVEDIVSYLKAWRPPVEYYARRRHRHPYLLYPSRRPSLPILLEERVDGQGIYSLVRPESALPRSTRARYHSPSHGRFQLKSSTTQNSASQGRDDDSDEELNSDDSDDEDAWSDSETEEAVTPTNSPISKTTYFLQPLILTKPPGC